MGQKSNPIGLRLQINRTWTAAGLRKASYYGRLLLEDLRIRRYIMKSLPQAGDLQGGDRASGEDCAASPSTPRAPA